MTLGAVSDVLREDYPRIVDRTMYFIGLIQIFSKVYAMNSSGYRPGTKTSVTGSPNCTVGPLPLVVMTVLAVVRIERSSDGGGVHARVVLVAVDTVSGNQFVWRLSTYLKVNQSVSTQSIGRLNVGKNGVGTGLKALNIIELIADSRGGTANPWVFVSRLQTNS